MTRTFHYNGRWIRAGEISGLSPSGRSVQWEFVTRERALGAVSIAAIKRGNPDSVILVKQYRPPLDAYILEFPAGLIEPGASPQETALRELQEETGCTGEILSLGPPVFNTPGLTDECTHLAVIEITGTDGDPVPQDDEEIERMELPLPSLLDELLRLHAAGLAIDAKLWSFATGLLLAHPLMSRNPEKA